MYYVLQAMYKALKAQWRKGTMAQRHNGAKA
jgi:hypothetical protein